MVLAAAWMICSANVAAQQATSPPSPEVITIRGTVRNGAGEPVEGASVVLKEQGSAEPVETKTNAEGSFTLRLPRAGTYTVRAEKSGLRQEGKAPLVLAAGETKHVDIVLAPTAMEFKDEPDFTVAGITDWSNVGLHGSDTTSRTSETLAKETLALKPDDVEKTSGTGPAGKYALALECKAKGDFTQAREQVLKVLATSDDAEGHHLLGDLNERLSDPLDAVREYERAARMNPSEQNYFDWGAELLLHKAAQPAIEVFTKGSNLHPRSPRMRAGLAAAFYAVGSYDEAARRLCEASDLKPDDPSPYLFLGQMEKTAPTSLPCSEEKLARFVRDQPANALANYYYAVSLRKRQTGPVDAARSRQVEALLDKAVTLEPELGEAYVQLGILYFEGNELTRAIQAYRRAIQLSPQLSEAHYRLSLVYKRTGDDAQAHQELEAYRQARKHETETMEQQGKELGQFLIILKNQPGTIAPH